MEILINILAELLTQIPISTSIFCLVVLIILFQIPIFETIIGLIFDIFVPVFIFLLELVSKKYAEAWKSRRKKQHVPQPEISEQKEAEIAKPASS